MLYTTQYLTAAGYGRLSIGILRYNLHAIHNMPTSGQSAQQIVYWDFKDTICMLYTTQAADLRPKQKLSIGILKIQFACYTQRMP